MKKILFVFITVITLAGFLFFYNKEILLSVKTHQAEETENQDLMNIIKQTAKVEFQRPINATIDRIWKAIPGYDGYVIDINKSFAASQTRWKKNKTWTKVYKPLKPLIQLKTLTAAPIYRGNPQKQMVSFMVNVAWGNEYIPPILKTFKQHKVRATFFLDGSWLEKNHELAKTIMNEGHELSNHGYSHRNMSELSVREARSEIIKTEQLLRKLGVKNQLFAPPSGNFDDKTVSVARDLELYTVLWTVDTVDWRKPSSSQIISKLKTEIGPGSLILMHPTESSAIALPTVIADIFAKELQIDTVSYLLDSKRASNLRIE
jgi:probable sporulation protein (polysaccharide deacetylase family)